ncbi:MAG: hypothetical protein ACMXYA_00990 [Candidatus Woesearchaeota archaeon]
MKKILTKIFQAFSYAFTASQLEETITESVKHIIEKTEQNIERKIQRFKKIVLYSFLQFIFLCISILSFIVAGILYLQKWIPIELVFLILAVLSGYVVLIFWILQQKK